MAKDQFRIESTAEPLSNLRVAEDFTRHEKHQGHVDPTCAWCVYDAHLDGDEQFLSKVDPAFASRTLAAMEAIKNRRTTDAKSRLYSIVKQTAQNGDKPVRPSELLAKAQSNDGNY